MALPKTILPVQVLIGFFLSTVVSLIYKTTEELPAGTVIGNVADTSGLKSSLSPDRLAQLKFKFLVYGYPDTKHFTIGERTSEIRTKHKLDREQLCHFKSTCELNLVVGVLSDRSDFYQVVPIEVSISDVNDNPPKFSKSVLQVSIPESATAGSRHIIPTATDDDIGNNTVQTYKLITKSDIFILDVKKNSDGQTEAFLVLNGLIDREKSETYQLKILAMDGGEPPKIGTVTINISVTDVNDHAPVFSQPRYETSFKENTKVGRTVLRIEATDFDYGSNGHVTYEFGPQTSDEVKRVFSLHESNGKIKLEQKVDYETKTEYHFTVKATDHGSPPKTDQAAVHIEIEDTNDNAPSLHFNLLSGGDFAMLLENATIGSFIAHLSVVDGDHDRNGRIACRVSPNGFILQRLYAKEYTVLLNRTLDREIWQGYEVRVACHDGGNPQKTGSSSFHVEVMDVNDNPPLFQPPNYRKSLLESNKTDQFIVQVFTTDKDAGDNRNVSYYLESHKNLFSVDENGIITSKVKLDREQNDGIELIVVARDHGKPPLSSTAVVDIIIEDVNDNKPIFTGDYDTFHVLEDEQIGTFVGCVTASDRDEGKNGAVSYSFMVTPSSNIPFSIDSYGTIKTTGVLDREIESAYMLTIVAEDQGPIIQQSSIISIPVLIDDKNDNDPFFVFPNDTNNTVKLFHTAYVGTRVAVINATDKDKGENATITYRIVSGNKRNNFQIDERSGEIFLVKELLQADIGQHFIFISASDGGVPPRRKSAKLLVNIHLGNITHLFSPSKGNGTAIDSMIIGISLALTAILLAIIIIVTIVIVRIRRRKRTNEEQSTRAEAEHMMSVSSSDHGGFGVAKSPKQNTLTKDDTVLHQSQFALRPEIPNNCHTLPSPTFSTFTGQNSYMASVDHHSNMTYPQDCTAVNIADRVPPDGQDVELSTAKNRVRSNSPSYETYRSLERDPTKRLSDVPPHLPDVLQKLDTHSDISGETTASDSGRGGSEEDTKNSINNNIKGCDKAGKCRVKKATMGQLMRPVLTEEDTVNQRIKTWMADQHPQQPFYNITEQAQNEHSKPDSINPSVSDHGIYSEGALSPSISSNYTSVPLSWQAGGVASIQHKRMNSPKHFIPPSLREHFSHADNDEEDSDMLNESTPDDDDGGTTTSGSYVVSPEDICDINELYQNEIPGVDV